MALFKTLSSENVYSGRIIDVNVDKVEFNGKAFNWEIVKSQDAVVIVPYLGDNQFVMIKQYRHTIGQYVLEFPAGRIESGETIEFSVQRELEEECCYRAKKITKLISYFPSPGVFTEKMYLYFASGLYSSLNGVKDDDEVIEPIVFDFEQIGRLIDDGEIIDAKTILSYYYLSANKEIILNGQ